MQYQFKYTISQKEVPRSNLVRQRKHSTQSLTPLGGPTECLQKMTCVRIHPLQLSNLNTLHDKTSPSAHRARLSVPNPLNSRRSNQPCHYTSPQNQESSTIRRVNLDLFCLAPWNIPNRSPLHAPPVSATTTSAHHVS